MSQKITIIGTGNLAWHIAPALERAGYVIHEIYGRSPKKAEEIAQNLYSPVIVNNLDFGESTAHLFLLAVSDEAIETIASEIVLPDQAMIAHTSGTVPLNVLEITAADRYGVFYPLQTFSRKASVNMQEVPFLVEANTTEGVELLTEIGNGLSQNVQVVNSEKRLQLHLAAVFVSNFTNHLLTIGKHLTEDHQLDFNTLTPLIRETIEKALKNGPANSQTGPAIREDYKTIEKHLALLEDREDYQKLYKLLSQSIIDSQY